jgi:hypothetical protein
MGSSLVLGNTGRYFCQEAGKTFDNILTPAMFRAVEGGTLNFQLLALQTLLLEYASVVQD